MGGNLGRAYTRIYAHIRAHTCIHVQIRAYTYIFGFQDHPEMLFGVRLRCLWEHFGCLWGAFGVPWGSVWATVATIGSPLAASFALLGPLWEYSELFGGDLLVFWALSGVPQSGLSSMCV